MVELQYAKLTPYGKNEAGGMKDKWNIMINNHESTGSGIYWNDVGDPNWKLSG